MAEEDYAQYELSAGGAGVSSAPLAHDALLDVLAELGERIALAQERLGVPEPGADQAGSGSQHHLPEIFAIARAAVAGLGALSGLAAPEVAGRIVLERHGPRLILVVDPSVRPAELALFLAALRHSDQRLLDSAELLGLLLGLAAQWATAGFAPPIVLASLLKSAPRILELGRELLADQADTPPTPS